jgi:hypothetical protein
MSRKVCLLSFGVERGPRRGRPLIAIMGSRPRPRPAPPLCFEAAPAPFEGEGGDDIWASCISHRSCHMCSRAGERLARRRAATAGPSRRRLCSNCPPCYTKLCLCGHSLGGGLAALMAVLIGPMLRKRYGWRLAGWRGPAPCLGGRGLMAHGRSRAGTRGSRGPDIDRRNPRDR